jgi:GNAT superfamily N-acetyltransferase
MEVRVARPEEYEELGAVVAAAYAAIYPTDLGSYEAELRAVGERAECADVLVAVDGEGAVLGGVTYVPGPDSPWADFREADAAGIRMLAVAAGAQGKGVGEALVRACLERARAAGRRKVVLRSTDWMTTAHRLYQRLGFERVPAEDRFYDERYWLRYFRLAL